MRNIRMLLSKGPESSRRISLSTSFIEGSGPVSLAEVELARVFVLRQIVRRARRPDTAIRNDVRPLGDLQGCLHVVVRDQDADVTVFQVVDDPLDVLDGDGVDPGEG